MRHFFPDKFGVRERLLSLLAVVMAIVSGWLSWNAGYGLGAAWIFFTVLGTLVLVIVAGSHRCFFTALFTSLLTIGLTAAFALSGAFYFCDGILTFFIFGVFSVLLPTAFAWLVTKILRYARPAA